MPPDPTWPLGANSCGPRAFSSAKGPQPPLSPLLPLTVLSRIRVNIPNSCPSGRARPTSQTAGEWARREDGERGEGATPEPWVGGPGTKASPGTVENTGPRSALQTRTQISGSGPRSVRTMDLEGKWRRGDHYPVSVSLLEGKECFPSPRLSRSGERHHFQNALWFAAGRSSTSWV